MGLGHGLELTPCEGCESLALPPPGSVTLPSLRQPPYGRVSERVILRNDPESESESESLSQNPAAGVLSNQSFREVAHNCILHTELD